MFGKLFGRIFLLLFLLNFLLLTSTLPVNAGTLLRSNHKTTLISLVPIREVSLGDPFIVYGTIKDLSGNPVVDGHIFFSIDNVFVGQAKSDQSGAFDLKVTKKFDAGSYVISATYKGSRTYVSTEVSIPLHISISELTIQTIPILSGIPFRMKGITRVSDDNGVVKFQFTKQGTYRLDVLVDEYNDPSVRIEFGRWSQEDYESYRDIHIPEKDVIEVGINVFHKVSHSFTDLADYSVPFNRITSYTIKSSQGDLFTFSDDLPHWIPASRIARRITGLEETKLLYSMVNVTVDGSNVVNQSQQRYYASVDDTWQTSLLLYSMQIHARDGLFDSPVGKRVNLQYPDGQVESFPLDSAGNAEIHSLARGLYTFKLDGVNGLSNKIPVALSRDQVVNVKVITFLDLTIVGIIGLAIVIGLILYGRPWLLKPFMKKDRKLVLEGYRASIHEN